MFHTLQEYRDNPLWIKNFTHIMQVPCICGRCGKEHYKVKRSVEYALAKDTQEHFFCTKECRGLFQGELWEVRDGIEGRICTECHQWTPKSKMHGHRGWVCNSCFTDHPRFKFRGYRQSARIRHLTFTLTYDEFMSFWQKPCSYCGASIKTIGLDRRDNDRGYEIDNVTPCCSGCNWMKGEDPVEVFKARCARVARKHS